jgi:hypothetical protein
VLVGLSSREEKRYFIYKTVWTNELKETYRMTRVDARMCKMLGISGCSFAEITAG